MPGRDSLRGGTDTARTSAAEQDRIARAERQAAALAYLIRTGNADVAEPLGLVEPPARPRRRTKAATTSPGDTR
jgi:hypothetical protein